MESNNNKPIQQKTFNKNVAITTGSNPATTGSLNQKTFKKCGANNKTKQIALNKSLQRKKKLLGNILTKKNVTGLVCVAWIVILGILNYSILYKLDFRVRTGMDWVYLIIMMLVSVSKGVQCFVDELENRQGYVLKYIVAVVIGLCGNLAGLLFSLIGCLIFYGFFEIVKWFVG